MKQEHYLSWESADGQGSMPGGAYPTLAAARAAIAPWCGEILAEILRGTFHMRRDGETVYQIAASEIEPE